MTKQQKILYGVAGVVIILTAIIVITIFRSTRSSDSGYKQLIEAKDETIKAYREQREALTKLSDEKDKNIAASEKQDSIILTLLLNNKPKYIINDKKSENIPAAVRSLSKDSLRLSAITY